MSRLNKAEEIILSKKGINMPTNEKKLKLSPIYNISLCSLENFHTYFWNWIGNNYPKDFLRIFTDKDVSNNAKIEFDSQVQYGNSVKLDLQIKITEGTKTEYIFIENKLKSFPTDEQLNKYSEFLKDKQAVFILLSLAPKLNLPGKWQYRSYFDFANKLERIFNSNFEYNNPYHKFLIEDYVSTVESISEKFPVNDSEKYDFYLQNQLDEIGLKDIYIKYRTSEFTNYIRKILAEDSIFVGYSFHNKKGTIDVFKEFSNPDFIIGVQIEGNQYRYFMRFLFNDESEDANLKREVIAHNVAVEGLWFNYTQWPNNSQIYKTFFGYRPDFIYRYNTLEEFLGEYKLEKISYHDIGEFIKKDMHQLDKDIEKIKQIIIETNEPHFPNLNAHLFVN